LVLVVLVCQELVAVAVVHIMDFLEAIVYFLHLLRWVVVMVVK
jgi:hypothetical protein